MSDGKPHSNTVNCLSLFFVVGFATFFLAFLTLSNTGLLDTVIQPYSSSLLPSSLLLVSFALSTVIARKLQWLQVRRVPLWAYIAGAIIVILSSPIEKWVFLYAWGGFAKVLPASIANIGSMWAAVLLEIFVATTLIAVALALITKFKDGKSLSVLFAAGLVAPPLQFVLLAFLQQASHGNPINPCIGYALNSSNVTFLNTASGYWLLRASCKIA